MLTSGVLKANEKNKEPFIAQLELPIDREKEPDRNFHKGGRSFYFFDFDDNIAFLSTPVYIFHKHTKKELELSSGEYAEIGRFVGQLGPYEDYMVDFDEARGTFRNFRDQSLTVLERLSGERQGFVKDLDAALKAPDFYWKGPSWSCFYHAVFNQRPISMITARGHHPETIKQGIDLFVQKGYLPSRPNYLSLFPVNHPEVQKQLGFDSKTDVAQLKQAAIRESVKSAIEKYGESPYHRFGMSDDDPKNLRLITEEMARLKSEYTEMSFFVISTHKGDFIKREVFKDHMETTRTSGSRQFSLF